MRSKIKLSNLPSPPSNLAGQRRFTNLVEPNFVAVLHIRDVQIYPSHHEGELCFLSLFIAYQGASNMYREEF
jgi:hypothetical protein